MKKAGFTYIELLIALTLFTVGMVSVIQIFPINRRFLSQSSLTTEATFLAQEQIETVRGTAYTSLTTGNSPAFEPSHVISSQANDPLSQFTRQTVVAYVDPTSTPLAGPTPAVSYQGTATDMGLKKADITVSWKENNGVSRQLVVSTYVNSK